MCRMHEQTSREDKINYRSYDLTTTSIEKQNYKEPTQLNKSNKTSHIFFCKRVIYFIGATFSAGIVKSALDNDKKICQEIHATETNY